MTKPLWAAFGFLTAVSLLGETPAGTSAQLNRFPEPPPIADANPAVREEREVLVPTAFAVKRTADEMTVGEDNETLTPLKLMVGAKMVLGMYTNLYVYESGTERPAQ